MKKHASKARSTASDTPKDLLLPWIIKDAEQTAVRALVELGYFNEREEPIASRLNALRREVGGERLDEKKARAIAAWHTLESVREVRRLLEGNPKAVEVGIACIGMMGGFLDVLMGKAYHQARKRSEIRNANDRARFAASCDLLKKIEQELGPKARKKDIYGLYHQRAEKLGEAAVYVPTSDGGFRTWRSTNRI
jgi:hypothetical protein